MDSPIAPSTPLRYPFPPGRDGGVPSVLDWARENEPVCPVVLPSGDRVWMVTRTDDITLVLTDPRFSRNLARAEAPRFAGDDYTTLTGALFNLAGPRHTRVRQIIDRFYSPRAVRRYRPVIEEQAARLLEEMAQGPNPADLMTAYANALPLRAAREILAVPEHVAGIYHSSVVTQHHLGASAEAVTDFAREVIEAKRHDPDPAEPVGALIRAHSGSLISSDELIGTTAYLLITASEPLTAPLGTGALTLLTHPRQLRECVTDPGLWPGAVEEILRRHHGALGRPRVATEELSLHGVTIREGEGVCCAMPAATHDPAHYPEPSRFDIHRTTDSSLAFGAGPHACPGAPLARLFLHTAFEALFTRFPDLTLATPNYEIPWEGDLVFTKPACLPVTW
ncbi:cytochrome P450 [Streptomyces syringium]|uniref:cytochrome P450 n=1 Tax=Streptomyces syringium TaxID=76729 RepID=UPI0037CCEE77